MNDHIKNTLTFEIPPKMWQRLISQIEDNDYCYLCDNHPSHGHDKDCPLYTKKVELDE